MLTKKTSPIFVVNKKTTTNDEEPSLARRNILQFPFLLLPTLSSFSKTARATSSLATLLPLLTKSRNQLNTIPALIQSEEWDKIRTILSTPPLADCWTKKARGPLLQQVADTIGMEVVDGDEFAALEAGEEATSHLRFLDMAVYNNVFNPISAEGKIGATKELVRSYYEDPVMELKAAEKALDEVISLANPGP